VLFTRHKVPGGNSGPEPRVPDHSARRAGVGSTVKAIYPTYAALEPLRACGEIYKLESSIPRSPPRTTDRERTDP
jgi:hypothetical protein